MECYFVFLFLYDHMLDAPCLRILHAEILIILTNTNAICIILHFICTMYHLEHVPYKLAGISIISHSIMQFERQIKDWEGKSTT